MTKSKALVPLSKHFKPTVTGLCISGTPSRDDWKRAGEALKQAEGAMQWWLGDWWNYGEKAYGEGRVAAEELGLNYEVCRNVGSVAGKIKLSRRRDNLSFAHHQEVASLDEPAQEQFLDIAESESLSRNELRRRIKAHKDQHNSDPQWPDGKYQVILADPPWAYSNSGFAQSAESQYPTMPADEIGRHFADDINGHSTDETVLFMWATSPLLDVAFDVVAAWGFQYKASIVWVKNRAPGLGWWVRTYHEYLLICTRQGSPQPIDMPKSVVEAPVGRHSAKPDVFYEIIESMYPLKTPTRHLEMFCRRPREGWAAFGNEVS